MNNLKYLVAAGKFYFDRGYGILGYLKYLIALFGFDRVLAGQLKTSLFIILGYGIFCFIFGYFWCKWGFIDEENEVNNRFNPFQRQVRKKLKIKTFK